MEDNMPEKEQTTALIEEYAKLQKVKAAEDRDSDLDYQRMSNLKVAFSINILNSVYTRR